MALECLEQPPTDCGIDLAVPVHLEASIAKPAVSAWVVGVRSGADPAGIVERVLSQAVIFIGQNREHIAHAFANGSREWSAHPANHAPGQPVTVLVPHNV